MLGRLVHSADFERMRAAPVWSRSAHFAVHHVLARPFVSQRTRERASEPDLSTDTENNQAMPVDDLALDHWLGSVLPKRLARRSVTRNLLRRQIRAAVSRHLPTLPPGLWVVRLRASFPLADFPSAASVALRRVAGEELDRLLARRSR